MIDISENISDIRGAVYGSEVREAIAESLESTQSNLEDIEGLSDDLTAIVEEASDTITAATETIENILSFLKTKEVTYELSLISLSDYIDVSDYDSMKITDASIYLDGEDTGDDSSVIYVALYDSSYEQISKITYPDIGELIDLTDATYIAIYSGGYSANTALVYTTIIYYSSQNVSSLADDLTNEISERQNADDEIYTELSNNYYDKDSINDLISSINQFNISIVDELPETGENLTIYFVPADESENNNAYDEYLYLNESWELIGTTQVDLSDYYTKDEADAATAEAIDAENEFQLLTSGTLEEDSNTLFYVTGTSSDILNACEIYIYGSYAMLTSTTSRLFGIIISSSTTTLIPCGTSSTDYLIHLKRVELDGTAKYEITATSGYSDLSSGYTFKLISKTQISTLSINNQGATSCLFASGSTYNIYYK